MKTGLVGPLFIKGQRDCVVYLLSMARSTLARIMASRLIFELEDQQQMEICVRLYKEAGLYVNESNSTEPRTPVATLLDIR